MPRNEYFYWRTRARGILDCLLWHKWSSEASIIKQLKNNEISYRRNNLSSNPFLRWHESLQNRFSDVWIHLKERKTESIIGLRFCRATGIKNSAPHSKCPLTDVRAGMEWRYGFFILTATYEPLNRPSPSRQSDSVWLGENKTTNLIRNTHLSGVGCVCGVCRNGAVFRTLKVIS